MDLKLLLPFIIKQAIATGQVSPDEVMAQLQEQSSKKEQDRDNETVDSELTEDGEGIIEPNEEGRMLESGFKELELEEAVEKAKEEKSLRDTTNVSTIKSASYWDLLVTRYGNNRR